MDNNIFSSLLPPEPPRSSMSKKLAMHRMWLNSLNRERPDPEKPFRIGVYIRYFNQTKYDDYLEKHKSQFAASIAMCPKWKLAGYYVDYGSSAPKMPSSPEWARLLEDCMAGRVNLILTQKISNVSGDPMEMALCAQLLAARTPPVGIYFISEDIFTLASYYLEDLRDTAFLPSGGPDG